MSVSKKQQLSLFLVALSTSAPAAASTCTIGFYDPADGSSCVPAPIGSFVPVAGASVATPAPLGYFVPTTGASAANPSPPGFYVPTTGASAPTPAPVGFFAPNVGMTAAAAAPVGYYVPTTGNTAATAASAGYYAPAMGMSSELPAGGMAAPLTAAVQTSDSFSDLSSDLLDSYNPASMRLAVAYQHAAVDQEGLSSGDFQTHMGVTNFQADLLKNNTGATGVSAAYAHHNLTNDNDVSNHGNSYELGVYNTGDFLAGHYQAFLVFGQTFYENNRHVVATYTGGTSDERLKSDGTISWYGARSSLAYPLIDRISAIGQLGLLGYNVNSSRETGTATIGGSPATSVAALNADELNYVAVPGMAGIRLDIIQSDSEYAKAPVTLDIGALGNLTANEQKLRVNSSFAAGYSFDLPVQQTSTVAGFVNLRFNLWQMGNGFALSGSTQQTLGADSNTTQATLKLSKQL